VPHGGYRVRPQPVPPLLGSGAVARVRPAQSHRPAGRDLRYPAPIPADAGGDPCATQATVICLSFLELLRSTVEAARSVLTSLARGLRWWKRANLGEATE